MALIVILYIQRCLQSWMTSVIISRWMVRIVIVVALRAFWFFRICSNVSYHILIKMIQEEWALEEISAIRRRDLIWRMNESNKHVRFHERNNKGACGAPWFPYIWMCLHKGSICCDWLCCTIYIECNWMCGRKSIHTLGLIFIQCLSWLVGILYTSFATLGVPCIWTLCLCIIWFGVSRYWWSQWFCSSG